MASNSSYQYLNHDWATQLTMLKVIYDTENLSVKYYDEDNEEIGLNKQEDYNFAIQFAANRSDKFLKLCLKASNGTIIGKPSFKIDTNDSDIKRIVNNIQTNAQVLETDILANLPNDKKNWLVNYLDQLKKDIVKEMEVKIKDLVLSQSTVVLNNEQETSEERKKFDIFEMGNDLPFEDKIKKLLNLLSESRLSERPIKVAFLEEELQLTGALNAIFVKDLTMPDGTKCLPGIKFQKKWLIKNTGKLAWNNESFPVKLVCIAGNIPTQNGEFVTVENTEVDNSTIISVDLIAPIMPGEYFSEWVLVCNNFKFGSRIWASIEVVDDSNQLDSCSFRQSETSSSDDFEDEFVVVPDCFDLKKNWKSKINTQNDLETSYAEVREEKQEQSSNTLNIDAPEFTPDVKLPTQPIDINLSGKLTQDLKSPSSFSSLNLFRDAFTNVQMPSYVGDINLDFSNKEPEPNSQVFVPEQQSASTAPQVEIKPTTTVTQIRSQLSPVETFANVSKTMCNAIGSLGSVYQSGLSSSNDTNSKYMNQLIAMGFANRTLNNKLLSKYDNNVEKVITDLLEQQEQNFR